MPYRCPDCGETNALEFSYIEHVSERHSRTLGIESDGEEITDPHPGDDGDIHDSDHLDTDNYDFQHYLCANCGSEFSEFEYYDEEDEDEDEEEDEEDYEEPTSSSAQPEAAVKTQATTALQKINSEDFKAGIRVLRDILEAGNLNVPVTLTQQIKDALNSGDPDFPTIQSLLQQLS